MSSLQVVAWYIEFKSATYVQLNGAPPHYSFEVKKSASSDEEKTKNVVNYISRHDSLEILLLEIHENFV
ncbi:hypothetical protein TNCV_4726871 [Trichonephila clavipes]|nr:hypothetical protein TNCV_4726871 [Trichonephila clavipes]